jgi:hypothetical protein
MSDDTCPMVGQLAAMTDHAAMADWLLRCPIAMLLQHERLIRMMLDINGFEAGADYLDVELSAARQVRHESGNLGYATERAIGSARTTLFMVIVHARAAVAQAEGGDHG